MDYFNSFQHQFTSRDCAKGGRNKFYFSVNRQTIADLFQVSIYTVAGWIHTKRLNPYSFDDIILKYNNRHLLDRRRRKPTNTNS